MCREYWDYTTKPWHELTPEQKKKRTRDQRLGAGLSIVLSIVLIVLGKLIEDNKDKNEAATSAAQLFIIVFFSVHLVCSVARLLISFTEYNDRRQCAVLALCDLAEIIAAIWGSVSVFGK